jgi:predicted MPP superfamily phosphohydrolase
MENMPYSKKISRREFIRLLGKTFLSVSALGLFGKEYTTRFEPGWVDVTQVPLTLPDLGASFDGLKIAQISDIHMGGWMNPERLQHVVDLVLEQNPDLVAITGDFVVGHNPSNDVFRTSLIDLRRVLSGLVSQLPVFAVSGNHDHWTDIRQVRQMLEQTGIVDLSNRVHTFSRGHDVLHLAGLDDVYAGKPDLQFVVDALPEQGAAVLLVHEPDYADWVTRFDRFALQISGHSHGGQVILPFFGPPVLPHWAQKYPIGLHRVGSLLQYTNRGVGMTPPEVRFNCRPEVTVYTLNAE